MTTLNAAQLGAFSQFVYTNTATAAVAWIPEGFTRVPVDPVTDNGFYASAFLNRRTGQLVIAFRGSNDLSDWIANSTFVSGVLPSQFSQAFDFISKVKDAVGNIPDANIVLTGHSLGGGLAALASVATGIEAVTFDAPKIGAFMGELARRYGTPAPGFANKIQLYWASTDEIHKLGLGQIGIEAGVFNVERPSFVGQLLAVLGGVFLGPYFRVGNAALSAVVSWLGYRINDQHDMQKLLLSMQKELSTAVPLVNLSTGAVVSDDTSADAQEYKDQVFNALDPNLTVSDRTVFDGKEFDRLQIDGAPLDQPGSHSLNGSSSGASRDLIIGDAAADSLRGGDGEDVIFGGSGSDLIEGGAGDDVLLGSGGVDTYRFSNGDGHDTIIDTDGKGRIVRDGKAVVIGLKQDDTHWSLGSTNLTKVDDTTLDITFSDGADRITIKDFDFSAAKQDGYMGIRLIDTPADPQIARTIQGDRDFRRFTETLNAVSSDTVILIPEEQVAPGLFARYYAWSVDTPRSWLFPSPVSSTYAIVDSQTDEFGNVHELRQILTVTYEHASLDELDNAIRSDTVIADFEDRLFDSTGNDEIITEGGEDVVDAKRGGDDHISTGADRDTIADTGGGDDLIEAGENGDLGGDIVFSGAGKDTVYADTKPNDFSTGLTAALDPDAQGTNKKGDFIATGAGDDIAIGGADDDVLTGGDGNDVLVGGAGDDTILGDKDDHASSLDWTVTRTRGGGPGSPTFDVVFTSAGADPTSAPGNDALYGGAGKDWIFGGAGDDYIDGGSGDDIALGEGGSDVLIGGAGDDFLDGDSASTSGGDDFLDGGEGNDTLLGEGGDDVLFGGDGDDVLTGGDGNDVLYGGPGTDVLAGGAGKDTYVFNVGDGMEVIFDTPAGADDPEASVLVLGPGLSREDVKLHIGSLDIDLGGGDAIHFLGFNTDDPFASPVLDSIQFADGTGLSYKEVLDLGFDVGGTEGDDVLEGTAVTDRIDALGGNDTVFGKAGDDVISGGAGNDTIAADLGDDVVDGGDGDDQVLGGGGNDTLSGGAGNDVITGDTGNDVITGGAGDDSLAGNIGSDTYVFAAGDGHDTIDEQAVAAVNAQDPAVDVIRFAAGVLPSSVSLFRQADGDLVVRYGATDEIRVAGQYSIPGNAIERIEFADGSFIDQAALAALPVGVIQGTEGDDTLVGTDAAEQILGLGGNDLIDGGAGDDELRGGAGADTYVLDRGMGRDLVVDASPSTAEIGTLKLAAGFTLDHVKAARLGDDLLVSFRGTQEGALIQGYYDPAAPAQSWQVMLADGSTTSMEALIARVDPNADVVALSAMEDYKQGILSSWAADSRPLTLPTQAFVRTSSSQTTVSTFTDPSLPPSVLVDPPVTTSFIEQYGARSGTRVVSVPAFQRTIISNVVTRTSNSAQIQANVSPDLVTTTESHSVFLRGLPAQTAVSTSSFAVGPNTINTIRSSQGAGWVPIALDQAGTPDDVLGIRHDTEHRIVEEIHAGFGDNVIQGVLFPYPQFMPGTPNHVALIDAGDGDDIVHAGPEDFVYGNDGNDAISGGRIAYGGNGDDAISGSESQYGGAGNDSLQDGAYMDGGSGSDQLTGGDGATTFYVDPTEASGDTIADTAGIDQAAYESWYYGGVGVPTPDESRKYGGSWVIASDTNTVFRILQMGLDPSDHAWYARDEFVPSGDGLDALVYHSLDDLVADLDNARVPYLPEEIRYINPLPALPVVTANDYAALQPLYDAGLIDIDTVEIGQGVALEDMSVTFGIDEMLDFAWGTDQSLHVQLALPSDAIGTGIERLVIDGVEYGLPEVLAIARENVAAATAGDDVIVYTDLADTGSGLAGNDQLFGLSGNDVLDGGAGDDYVEGDSGNDILAGGDGADDVEDWQGNNVLDGGAGDDYFYADGRPANAGGGANFVVGGAGFDWVDSYAAGNVVALNHGDGTDTVAVAAAVTLSLGGGIAAADLTLSRDGDAILLSTGAAGEGIDLLQVNPDPWPGITLQLFDGGTVSTYALNPLIEEFLAQEASNPSVVLSLAALLAAHQLSSSTVEALGGALAYQYATTGNISALSTAQKQAVLAAPDFGLVPQSITGSNTFTGTAGNDVVVGTSGADTLAGGAGNDVLDGAGGSDTYVFNLGDGVDTIVDTGTTGTDTLAFGAGISPDAVSLGLGSLLIRVSGSTDAVHVEGFDPADAASPGVIERYTFADGTVLTHQDLVARGFDLSGTAGDDTITGTSVDDRIDGGAGNDVLDGGTGIDTYLFGRGDGQDTIQAPDTPAGEIDILRFKTGVAPADIQVSRDGDDLVATIAGTTDSIRIVNAATHDIIELVEFADGTFWSEATLRAKAEATEQPPVLANPVADQSATEDSAFTFTVPANAFSDPDAGDTLSYTATRADGTALPAWLAFDPATRTFSGTPANADVGTVAVKVTATDGSGAFASDTFDVTVANTNDAPVAQPDSVSATEDATTANLAPQLLANDTDIDAGDTRSITAVDTTGTTGTVSFDAATQTLTYAADAASQDALAAGQTTTDTFSYTMADAAGASSTASVTVTVTGVNDAPVLATPIADQSARSGQAFSFQVSASAFTDVDAGDTLTYGATLASGAALPAWLAFDAAMRTFSGTPGQTDVGTISVKVTATDAQGAPTSDTFDIVTTSPRVDGTAGDDVLTGSDFSDTISGFAGNDTLYGLGGNDALSGGSGSDNLDAGAGDDTLYFSVDATWASGTNTANFGSMVDDEFTGTLFTVDISGKNESLDYFMGGAGIDTIVGTSGDDVILLQNQTNSPRLQGIEVISLGDGNDVVNLGGTVNYGDIIVDGGAGNDTIWLSSGNDTLIGGAGNDDLDGNVGADVMIGGSGDDTYWVQDPADIVIEQVAEGIDTVYSTIVDYTLPANVENLVLFNNPFTGEVGFSGTGNDLDNFIRGGIYDSVLSGGLGNDTLDGYFGADTMLGGQGDDTYFVDNVGDVVTENAGEGTDTVRSTISYTLAANVENLVLLTDINGNPAISGTGNALDNVITGNSANNSLTGGGGNDTLDGGAGSDNMVGGTGNDTYIVDVSTDVVTENANEGTDTVQSSITYTLGANVENLTLIGTAAINGTGNALDNVLRGNGAANTLAGGTGNDTYFVSTGDTVSEGNNAGTDTVTSDVTWTLGSNLENLTLIGTAAINGTGNTLNNVLTGNAGNNTLSGGTGADTMSGGAGDDTYVVDNAGDVVSENPGEGIDTVQSSVTYTITDPDVENLTLTGTTAINGTGNASDNVLTGNSGTNVLTGGAGNDTYFIGSGDSVVENAAAGEDIVNSSVTFTLSANVEHLILTGTTAVNGTGNTLNNLVRGNDGANTLTGAAGIDVLEGGAGNDTLSDSAGTENGYMNGGSGADTMTGGSGRELYIGGTGNDTITTGTGVDILAFNRGDGLDTVNASSGADNVLSLGGGIAYADLAFRVVGADLVLDTGASESLTFKSWYTGTTNKSVGTLQVLAEAMPGYSPTSPDPLLDNKVETFNFTALVAAFDAARAANQNLTSWNLMNGLLDAHLSGSDTAALGGDLAYQYGVAGTVAGIGFNPAQTELSSAQFGTQAQTLQPLASLQQGVQRLS